MNALLDELRAIAGVEHAFDDAARLDRYLTDWRGVFHGSALAVVRPADAEQVSRVVRACVDAGVAIVPQGGNTGLAAGATPLDLPRCIVLSLERMRSIRAIDPSGFTIAVDAGCVLADVQQAAADAQRFFPLSLAAEGTAQIGGLLATNAGGTAVLRYGTMRALALGIEAVLPDGTVVDGMRALRKDNAGYDWKQVLIGSEGTLGIITGAVLRLFPRPASTVTALLACASLDAVVALYARMQNDLGETLTAFEMFSERCLALRLEHEPQLERPVRSSPWYVLLEASSALVHLPEAIEAALAATMDEGGVEDAVLATSSSQARALWSWRESITEHERRAGASAKHDVSVAVSSIPAFVREATQAVESSFPGAVVLAFGHVGDGNVHFNVVLPRGTSASAVNDCVHDIVRAMRGSPTAEHGVGRYRRQELLAVRSPGEIQLMRALKGALDPRGLMNPGAVLEP